MIETGTHKRGPRVRLIADDLTGALDSGVQFTGIADLRVALDDDPHDGTRSLALNLACRDGSREKAIAAASATAGFFHGAGIAFKKIDSLLRGHWAAEISALVRARRFGSVVLAPAFPAQGRVTRGGRQHWCAPDGDWHPVAVDMTAALIGEGLTVGFSADHSRCDVLIVDAETQNDLTAAVAERQMLERPILWCGAAGLARALAGAPPRQAPMSQRPHLTLIGSNHPVSNAQLGRLEAELRHLVLRCGADDRQNARQIEAALARDGRCVALAALPDESEPAAAASRIAAWLDATLRAVAPPVTLTVVGGETLAAVCRALDVRSLEIEGELEAGVPCSSLRGGPWDGVLCFSKSGAFGDPDWLRSHVGPPQNLPG